LGKRLCTNAPGNEEKTREQLIAEIEELQRRIEEHKWMEDALMSSEEYFRSLIESSQDCMCNISIDGLYMMMNPAGFILNDIDCQEDII